ncbi:MAG TPA: type I methionyl aminopeptidase [Patescibacteria group bacterium]|jgi:methionyl aminopeptidase
MIISSAKQLKQYRTAAKISTEILWQLHQKTAKGVTPLEIDALADRLCRQHNVRPNFKGVGSPQNPYQHATCISVNDTVVHGIPQDVPLMDGDLVKVDFGIEYEGLNTDHCFTIGIGELTNTDTRLLTIGRSAVLAAAKNAIAGKQTGDLGNIMETTARKNGFSVTKQYVGHGIGRSLHEEPQLPAWGKPGTGTKLMKGMVLCVEAQLLAGGDEVYVAPDGWSVKTQDGGRAVMFEFMVIVDSSKSEILTQTMAWPLLV